MPDDEGESGILSSLPNRPLTMQEGQALADGDSGIVPLSVSTSSTGEQFVFTLWVTSDTSDYSHLLGFSETSGGWTKIKTWTRDDWSLEEQNELVQSFLNEEYGDEHGVSQVMVDAETGEMESPEVNG